MEARNAYLIKTIICMDPENSGGKVETYHTLIYASNYAEAAAIIEDYLGQENIHNLQVLQLTDDGYPLDLGRDLYEKIVYEFVAEQDQF